MEDDLKRLKQVCDSLASRIESEHEGLLGEAAAGLRESLQNLLRVQARLIGLVRAAKLQVKHRLLLAQLDRLGLISARDSERGSEFDLLVTGSIEQVDEQGR